jgi:DNA-directed RNA polymerase subunit RPC12/RpoP
MYDYECSQCGHVMSEVEDGDECPQCGVTVIVDVDFCDCGECGRCYQEIVDQDTAAASRRRDA